MIGASEPHVLGEPALVDPPSPRRAASSPPSLARLLVRNRKAALGLAIALAFVAVAAAGSLQVVADGERGLPTSDDQHVQDVGLCSHRLPFRRLLLWEAGFGRGAHRSSLCVDPASCGRGTDPRLSAAAARPTTAITSSIVA